MPTSFGGSSKEQKGKKPHKNKPTSQKYKKYADGKKGKNCPRCGPGIFLALHKDRVHCGKCNYTEFTSKTK
jgi:small subunit ribosomal protein S27Ae